VSPIQQRSVGEYPGVYGVVKSFNDRPRGSTFAHIAGTRKPGNEKKREREREREAARRWKARAISQSSKCRFNAALTTLPRLHIWLFLSFPLFLKILPPIVA